MILMQADDCQMMSHYDWMSLIWAVTDFVKIKTKTTKTEESGQNNSQSKDKLFYQNFSW